MVPGIAMTLADAEYIVPPLSLGSVEVLQKRIAGVTGTPEDAPVIADVLHHALLRNYPTLTRKQVVGSIKVDPETGDVLENIPAMVGFDNMAEVFEACMDVGGFKRKKLEADKLGEVQTV